MAVTFPSSPTNGQIFSVGDLTRKYNSSTGTWDVVATTIQGITGSTGPTGLVVSGTAPGSQNVIWLDTSTAGVQAISPNIVTAKGDILAGSATGVVTNLPVGTDGQILKADSTQTTGLSWGSINGKIYFMKG